MILSLAAMCGCDGDERVEGGQEGGERDAGDGDGCPAESPEISSWDCDDGDVCPYPISGGETEVCACSTSWGTVCSSCPWDDASQDIDLSSCTAPEQSCWVADWEHDWDCDCVAPEMEWRCCSAQFSGTYCQGGACGSEEGTPCCEGQTPDDPSLSCVAGRWQTSS